MLFVSLNARSQSIQKQTVLKEDKPVTNISTSLPGANNDTQIETGSSFDSDTSFNKINTKYNSSLVKLKEQAEVLKKYVKENNYNGKYCFLVDMSIPSGKKRFFVYNLKKDSIEFSSLVTHGFGSYKWDCNDQLSFSNMPFSLKTSLGKYRIGTSYTGHFGLAYKLFGLDSSNSNAYQRDIVLHSHIHVPDKETYPEHIMESLGCPAVSPVFLAILDKYVKENKKSIILWIYD